MAERRLLALLSPFTAATNYYCSQVLRILYVTFLKLLGLQISISCSFSGGFLPYSSGVVVVSESSQNINIQSSI